MLSNGKNAGEFFSSVPFTGEIPKHILGLGNYLNYTPEHPATLATHGDPGAFGHIYWNTHFKPLEEMDDGSVISREGRFKGNEFRDDILNFMYRAYTTTRKFEFHKAVFGHLRDGALKDQIRRHWQPKKPARDVKVAESAASAKRTKPTERVEPAEFAETCTTW